MKLSHSFEKHVGPVYFKKILLLKQKNVAKIKAIDGTNWMITCQNFVNTFFN
jgi:hypothetical protein